MTNTPNTVPDFKTEPYKFVYALVLATLTAAAAIWVNNPWLTGALAIVTAVGVYFVPNPPKPDATTRTDGPGSPDYPVV